LTFLLFSLYLLPFISCSVIYPPHPLKTKSLIFVLFFLFSHSNSYCQLTFIDTIHFAGLIWDIKSGYGGPGPNYWSDSPQNVWLDDSGQLHLKIRQDENDSNKWYCSEIIAQQSYGYGEYRFYVSSNVNNLDSNIVVGLFTYETDVDNPINNNQELAASYSDDLIWLEEKKVNLDCLKSSEESYISVTSPNEITTNGPLRWPVRSNQDIKWEKHISGRVIIELYKGGEFYSTIISNPPGDSIYRWLIPSDQTPGTDYKIKITSVNDNSISDLSDTTFTICIHREIDIEFSRWADPAKKNGWFTVQPTTSNSQKSFNLNCDYSTHKFIWNCSNIFFQSYFGHYSTLPDPSYLIDSFTYTNELPSPGTNNPPSGNERLHINIFLYHRVSPSLYRDVEVVIKNIYIVPINISVISPIGGEIWNGGHIHNITWNSSCITGNVKIELVQGTNYSTIAPGVPNNGSWTWNISQNISNSDSYRIKISSINDTSINDISNGNFTIVQPPVLLSPANGSTINNLVLLHWTNVIGANGYELIIDGTLASSPSQSQYQTSLNAGLHHWEVRSVSFDGYSVFSDEWNFIVNTSLPCLGIPTVSYAGKTYNTVQIGTQCWMKGNLNIGSKIPVTQEQTNNGVVEKYCYNDLEPNCDIYGALYQWNEMMQYSTTGGVQGICPTGWHLPSDIDWTTLTSYLGGINIAGGKVKEPGYIHWLSPNTGANNECGFTALPGGFRFSNGSYSSLGSITYIWSSTEESSLHSWVRDIDYNNTKINRTADHKTAGFSVRCLKDASPIIPFNQSIQSVDIVDGQVSCYNATQTIDVAGNGTSFIVHDGGNVKMIAGQNIRYLTNTIVQWGGYMWGYIAPSGPFCVNPTLPAVDAIENEVPKSIELSSFIIYPNPTTGNFILELKSEVTIYKISVEVYGMWGERVLSEVINGERKNEFSLPDRPSGIYFIRVISGNKAETSKLIKH
jgi:uncharacterized protein (TIGR02145 family)